jgi:hypothetical protein
MFGPTEEAAEKLSMWGEMSEEHPSGAEAHHLFSASCGTTEVVPCYKTLPDRSFSAAGEVVPLLQSARVRSFAQ